MDDDGMDAGRWMMLDDDGRWVMMEWAMMAGNERGTSLRIFREGNGIVKQWIQMLGLTIRSRARFGVCALPVGMPHH